MGLLKSSALWSSWQRGRGAPVAVAPVYLFAGEETFLRDEALRHLEDLLLTDETRLFNREVVSGASADFLPLVQACETLPLKSSPSRSEERALGGSPRERLIIVKEAQRIVAAHQAELAPRLSALPETTCLVLLWEGPWRREELKRPLVQEIQRVGEVVEFLPLTPSEAVEWLMAAVKRREKCLQPVAAQALYETTEGTLRELAHEVDKLCWFVGTREEITTQDISQEGGYREADPLRWVAALKLRDLPVSLALLQQLLQEGEEPVRLLHLAARSVIRERQISPGMTPLETWRSLTQAIQAADLAIKTGRETPAGALTRLTVQVCQPGGPSSARRPSSG
ncbi:MAG: hypothetical protein HYZ73_01295 [Elusimicrobia bacterium]|nr:hypothetical protein [Elusimicrobiota bacterium]